MDTINIDRRKMSGGGVFLQAKNMRRFLMALG
jgi:hypothetical protein